MKCLALEACQIHEVFQSRSNTAGRQETFVKKKRKKEKKRDLTNVGHITE